jgi:undecaprenyl diphosphate synthase
MQQESTAVIPTHLGFIIDGNRRWAKQHGVPSYEGHLAGYNALKDVLYEAFDQGVKFASVYAFSTENWKRAEEEVGYLMKLTLRMVKSDLHELVERRIRFKHLGSKEGLPDNVAKALAEAEEKTKDLDGGTLCACFNYGGQREIVDAVRKCMNDGLTSEQIDEEAISARLYAPDVPPIDMMIRTSGEHRISNFMLWRITYAELLFIDKFWPSMTKEDVTSIIEEYGNRNRRFGGN